MALTKTLIAPCSIYDHEKDEAILQSDALLQRLLFFDKYILQSTRLKEMSHIVSIFGLDGTCELLKSGVLCINCDAKQIAQTGQTTIIRKDKGILPPCSYSFRVISPSDRKSYFHSCLQDVQTRVNGSTKDVQKLKRAIISSLVEPLLGNEMLSQLESDLKYNHPSIKRAIIVTMERQFGVKNHASELEVTTNQIADINDYHVSTNIGKLHRLNTDNIHKLIERSLLSMGSLHQRIQEMRQYNAVSGFIDEDLIFYTDRLGFIVNKVSPHKIERQMNRIIALKGLPTVNGKVDVDKLMKVRSQPECIEFRKWLMNIGDADDAEILKRISSVRARISDFMSTRKGGLFKMLVTSSTGLVFGPLAGAFGIADLFLRDRILPHSGISAFVNRLYPSLFPETRKR